MKKLLFSLAAVTAITTATAQKALVHYYTEGGTTKTVAEELQKQTGADIEAILRRAESEIDKVEP